MTGPRRLNWGCGAAGEPGWVNSDIKSGPLVQLPCDIREGLPVPDGAFTYIVSIHALPEIPLPDLPGVLRELRRVLAEDGAIRLAVPDMDRAYDAYRRGDADYFEVPDRDARSLGAKLVTQLVWYGYSRTVFTWDFLRELLVDAGFVSIRRCGFRETTAPFAGITSLDDRERETLFVEARKRPIGHFWIAPANTSPPRAPSGPSAGRRTARSDS